MDRILLSSKILSLQQTNDIYMTMNMVILTNQTNLNNVRFTEDFINGIVENKDKYIGIPLVVNKFKLENGQYNSLSHEFNPRTGELNTQVIGSFHDFWSETDNEGSLLLMGSVRIFKRYKKVCNAIEELYNSGDLQMSCEVLVYGYEEMENGVREIPYTSGEYTNELFGSAIVTDAAEVKSRATMLIAEALNNDLNGGDDKANTVIFNKGNQVKYNGKIESSELSFDNIAHQIYDLLNPTDPETGEITFNYMIREIFPDYVIVEDWYNTTILYQIYYRIENDVVILDLQENWIRVVMKYVPVNAENNELLSDNQQKETHTNNKIKEDVKIMDEKELQAKIEELNKRIAELNDLVVSQKETITKFESREKELNDKIAELNTYKEKVEKAEREAKKSALIEKFSKLLSEDVMNSEEVKNALEELNENFLNEIVVKQVLNEKSKNKNDVVVSSKNNDDLIPQSLRDKLYTPKNE